MRRRQAECATSPSFRPCWRRAPRPRQKPLPRRPDNIRGSRCRRTDLKRRVRPIGRHGVSGYIRSIEPLISCACPFARCLALHLGKHGACQNLASHVLSCKLFAGSGLPAEHRRCCLSGVPQMGTSRKKMPDCGNTTPETWQIVSLHSNILRTFIPILPVLGCFCQEKTSP